MMLSCYHNCNTCTCAIDSYCANSDQSRIYLICRFFYQTRLRCLNMLNVLVTELLTVPSYYH